MPTRFRTFGPTGGTTVTTAAIDTPPADGDASVVSFPKPPDVPWSIESYPYADPDLVEAEPSPDVPEQPHAAHRRRHRNRR